jgi:hypothetical protein
MQAQNNQGNNKGGLSWAQPARNEGGFKPAGANKPTPQAAAPKSPAPLGQKPTGGAKPPTERPAGKYSTALWIGGGVVLGLILGSAFFGDDERRDNRDSVVVPTDQTPATTEETPAEETENNTPPPAGVGSSRDSFVVPPTQPAGRTVAVSQIQV